MKKVMILLVIALTANVMMAQKKDRTDAFMYNKNGQYEKAMKSIEKCVNHEQFLGMKPNDQATAWHYRAIIYQNVIQLKDKNLLVKAYEALGLTPPELDTDQSASQNAVLAIGSTKSEVANLLGAPKNKDVTTTEFGVGEWWEYGDDKAIHFDNGRVDIAKNIPLAEKRKQTEEELSVPIYETVYESLMNCMKNQDFLDDNKQDLYQRVDVVKSFFYNRGYDLYIGRSYDEAAPMFKKAYDIANSLKTPDANDILNAAAQSCLFAQNYNTALEYFTELKNNGMETADIYKHLAACYNGLGNGEQAKSMINAGLEKYPSDASLIVEKVNAYMKEGKAVEAVEDLDRLRELDPNNAQLLFALGTIYGDENNQDVYNTDKALKFYEDALKIKPDYYDAAYNVGVLYTSMANKYIEQANEITGFSKKEQDQYNGLIEQANEMLRTGLPYLKKAYDAQPSDDVKNVLKSIYVKLNMMEEVKALMGE